MRSGEGFELALELAIPDARAKRLPNGEYQCARYEVSVLVGQDGKDLRLGGEALWLAPARRQEEERASAQRTLSPMPRQVPPTILHEPRRHTPAGWRKVVQKVAESGNDCFQAETSGWNNPFRLGPTRSALANLPEDEERFPVATWVKRTLMEGVERVVLDASAMRAPSPPGSPGRFRPDGSNLPWAVEELRVRNRDAFARWLDHARTALPDLVDLETVERPEDRHRYLVATFENGLKIPSWGISDGSLRLLALTLLAYLPETGSVYLVEEPENGIDPRAVETVYQSLSSVYGSQVLCASHSPVILGKASHKDLLCFARDEDGATDIVRGDAHPRLRDWKGSLDLGTLFAAGVLG